MAWSDSNFENGIASIAAAVFDRHGKVVGAINVTGPSASFSTHAMRRGEIEKSVILAASMISGRLGFTGQAHSNVGAARDQDASKKRYRRV